jgi:SAM-dependent methyltransferase
VNTLARSFKAMLKTIPVIGPVARHLYFRILAPSIVSSAVYWESRYNSGGGSGAGSRDRLARFKAEVLNDFVRKNGVCSIVEFGCGDGQQLTLADYPEYVGLDISVTAIKRCRARFPSDRTKVFSRYGEELNRSFDLALSLDVIYHLVEDDVFATYMHALFDASHRWVIIFSSNSDEPAPEPYIKHRKFTDWVVRNRREWTLIEEIRNRYPYDRTNPDFTSFADFFIYQADVG